MALWWAILVWILCIYSYIKLEIFFRLFFVWRERETHTHTHRMMIRERERMESRAFYFDCSVSIYINKVDVEMWCVALCVVLNESMRFAFVNAMNKLHTKLSWRITLALYIYIYSGVAFIQFKRFDYMHVDCSLLWLENFC